MLARLILLFSLAAPALAFATSPPLIDTIRGEQPIRLQELRISSEISGAMAETTVRMVFFNPNARPLEGNLQFPLQSGQQVTAFALDFDGQMRPAVPVEKARGRAVFEEIARRGVDPALLENVQGNNFKLRIFPIAPRGTRTVELKYAEALSRDGRHWIYRLPLAYGDRLAEFDLKVAVHGAQGAPRASGALGDIAFKRTGLAWQATVARSRYTSNGALTLHLPATTRAQTWVAEHDGETWFLAEIPVSTRRAPRVLPKVVGLLWDSSGSASSRAPAAELHLLDRYFKALGNAEIRLTRLRDQAEATKTYQVVDGNWDALRTQLENTTYDGASALAAWTPQADVGEYLMVSDGLLNYGTELFPGLAPQQRLYVLNSSMAADGARMAALAERSGGSLVQVPLDRRLDSAAEQMLTDAAQVHGLRAEGATDLLAATPDARQGIMRVAGKLNQPTATVRFALVEQGKPREMTLDVSARSPRHALAAHLWAGYKLRALEADLEANRGAIRRLGLRFGLPTRESSLIVLDALEDYARYEIAPPAALLPAYEQLLGSRNAQRRQQRQKHLDDVVAQFKQKITWWEKSYPKEDPPKPEVAVEKSDRAYGRYAPVAASAPMAEAPRPMAVSAAPPPPSPAAPAQAKAKESASTASVGIALKKWTSGAPYVARLREAAPDQVYAVYLDEKPSYANSSGFYLDAADILLDKGQRELALRVLSNLAEMDLENRQVLRILGYRLLQAGAPELALPVFVKVLRLAEEEPQSFRDLGLAYAAAGNAQRAVDNLNEVVIRPWNGRFSEVELIVLAELNAIIARSAEQGAPLDTSAVDPRLIKNMPLDLRAVLTWDADNSDMDLWVTDPNGEKCYYGHRFTYQGGRMSRDFTGGYGPEEFSLRYAKPGKYKIEAQFYGSRQSVVAGATTLQLKLSSGFGTSKVKNQMTTLRLKGSGEQVFVGEFEVKP